MCRGPETKRNEANTNSTGGNQSASGQQASIIFKMQNTCRGDLKRVQAITLDCVLYLVIFLSFNQKLFWKFYICVPTCTVTWSEPLLLDEQMPPLIGYYSTQSKVSKSFGHYFYQLGKHCTHHTNCCNLGVWQHGYYKVRSMSDQTACKHAGLQQLSTLCNILPKNSSFNIS